MTTIKRKEKYYFRIIGLIQPLAELLKKELRVSNFTMEPFKKTNTFVIGFSLTENIGNVPI